MLKIITHGGQFHADELLAIATVFAFTGSRLPIERKFTVSQEEFEDSEVLILDLGRSLDAELNNFDHHQDVKAEATNILVLNHFCKDAKMVEKLMPFFTTVSDIDRGIVPNGGAVDSFNAVVRSMNSLPNGFEIALQFVETALAGLIASAKAAIEGEQRWESVEKQGRVAVTDSDKVIVGWQDLALRDGVLALVSPNVRGGYQILSRNSEIFQLPEDSRQTFRHPSGFMAVYTDKQAALDHATSLLG